MDQPALKVTRVKFEKESMKNHLKIFVLLGLISLLGCTRKSNSRDDSGPQYNSPKIKELVERMVEAHGGLKKWKSASTISYEHTKLDPRYPDDPWTSIEVIELDSRRIYQDWPADKAQLSFDGEKTWTVNWQRGNPPGMMAAVAFFFVNLPWLTQDTNVILNETGKSRFPHDSESKEYFTVKMTFDPGVGTSEYQYYKLFIDPDDYLLRGVEYTVTYGALLDAFEVAKDVKFLGPIIKIFDEYKSIEGLKLTTKYTTYDMSGKSYGLQSVTNIVLNQPFDENKMIIPLNAVIDKTGPNRKFLLE